VWLLKGEHYNQKMQPRNAYYIIIRQPTTEENTIMANFNRAKKAALQVPELKALIEREMNRSTRRMFKGDVIYLSKKIERGIEPIYVGPGPHLVLEWAARDRLAAKKDAQALAKEIAASHRKKYPSLYSK